MTDELSFDDLDAAEELLSSMEAPAESTGRFVARTLSEVAEFVGVSTQTAKEWRCVSPPMPGQPGSYSLSEITRWRLSRLRNNELSDELRRADLEKTQVQIEQARIALDEKKASVLDRADVELWAAVALTELREGIMQLPEILAASSPQELKDFTRQETDRHCRDLLTATHRRLELAQIGKER